MYQSTTTSSHTLTHQRHPWLNSTNPYTHNTKDKKPTPLYKKTFNPRVKSFAPPTHPTQHKLQKNQPRDCHNMEKKLLFENAFSIFSMKKKSRVKSKSRNTLPIHNICYQSFEYESTVVLSCFCRSQAQTVCCLSCMKRVCQSGCVREEVCVCYFCIYSRENFILTEILYLRDFFA